MASINISDADFGTIFTAAHAARDVGDEDQAVALDKIARKINAALTAGTPEAKIAGFMSGRRSVVRWQDMPSVFDSSAS